MPFHGQRDTEISYKVVHGDRPVMPANAGEVGISDGLWQLLVRCWNSNYTERPQIDEILQRLSQEPKLESIFPPSNISRAPSCETTFFSATWKHGTGLQYRTGMLAYLLVHSRCVRYGQYPRATRRCVSCYSVDHRFKILSRLEIQPFPMPASPEDTSEYSSRETRNLGELHHSLVILGNNRSFSFPS